MFENNSKNDQEISKKMFTNISKKYYTKSI